MLVFRYFAEEYGYVSGANQMKKEIWKRGPIGQYGYVSGANQMKKEIWKRGPIGQYGYVSGANQMKKEIWKRGPIGHYQLSIYFPTMSVHCSGSSAHIIYLNMFEKL